MGNWGIVKFQFQEFAGMLKVWNRASVAPSLGKGKLRLSLSILSTWKPQPPVQTIVWQACGSPGMEPALWDTIQNPSQQSFMGQFHKPRT